MSVSPASAISSPLAAEQLNQIDAWWRAANYLAVGMIYLQDNPLLSEPLRPEHIKNRLLGHWGSSPGQAFIWAHANRLIRERNLDMIYLSGPGHGAPGVLGPTYLDGSYSEIYPNQSQDAEGMRRFFKQFSFPGHIGSHCTPETPGSIHEGGELGYVLSHACGAVFDNPELIALACVGDGEAETGPLATSWHINKFLNPISDGAVLPVLHLNGYKIANPTLLARIPREELASLMRGYGWEPLFVEGSEPLAMHAAMAAAMEQAVGRIQAIQTEARRSGEALRPHWPMIVLRSPKGWTGPAELGGKKLEGFWRAHQVPLPDPRHDTAQLQQLEGWLKSYRPWELFDEHGTLKPELQALAPQGKRRMGSNPHANGGLLRRKLQLPPTSRYAVAVPQPGRVQHENTAVLGELLRDAIGLNPDSLRVFGPDETASNRLQAIYEQSKKVWMEELLPEDLNGSELSRSGRVVEMLSEHTLVGMMEGYLLTGRHVMFNCYEAFIHIIDSMFNQHAKWLKVTRDLPWRRPIASLNYVLSSLVWRQDHNGFSHQDPGFMDVVVNKKSETVRVYLPPDANTLLSVTDHCLRTRDYVNVIIAGKQPQPQWLGMDEAVRHCTAGLGIWEWASTDFGSAPDVVMACCGDVPTMETLAAVEILHEHFPGLKIRTVNVIDLMTLQPRSEHPHGMSDRDYDALFMTDAPIIFAFHGYPKLIHQLAYRRASHGHLHVRGYKEEGTTTTPFDMVVMNDLDRFHLAGDAVDRLPQLKAHAGYFKQYIRDRLLDHKAYIRRYGQDMPEIRNWRWRRDLNRPAGAAAEGGPHLVIAGGAGA